MCLRASSHPPTPPHSNLDTLPPPTHPSTHHHATPHTPAPPPAAWLPSWEAGFKRYRLGTRQLHKLLQPTHPAWPEAWSHLYGQDPGQLLTGSLRVPTLEEGGAWPAANGGVGGRFLPPVLGESSAQFVRLLEEAGGGAPLWADPEGLVGPAGGGGQGQGQAPPEAERFAFFPSWLVSTFVEVRGVVVCVRERAPGGFVRACRLAGACACACRACAPFSHPNPPARAAAGRRAGGVGAAPPCRADSPRGPCRCRGQGAGT